MTKPRVLIFSDYYLPGVKAGGPIRSLAGLVDALKNDVNFTVVTRDRDWGDGEPYPSLPTKLDEANIHYLSPAELTFSNMKRIVDEVSPQIIYLNSFFSWHFSIKLLCLQYIGRLKNIKILLAPRGEFSPGALRLKSIKKNIYLKFAQLLGMYKKISWHATSNSEEADIQSIFLDARIMLAGNLPSIQLTNDAQSHKREGLLRLVFLSRISRKKNLHFALDQLSSVDGEVTLDIYGPIEDKHYWAQCEQKIKQLPNNICVNYKGVLSHTDVSMVLSRYDAFILPTLGENYGHVIIEALASACPVLLSDATPWQAISDNQAGWTLSLEGSDEWRQQLQRLVYMGEQEHARLKRGALNFAQKVLAKPDVIMAAKKLFGV